MTLRVVIADDHPMVRYGIGAVLRDFPSIELVGEAADGDELLAVVERERPDVVLTDLAMPKRSGVEAVAALRSAYPELPVLVRTVDDAAID